MLVGRTALLLLLLIAAATMGPAHADAPTALSPEPQRVFNYSWADGQLITSLGPSMDVVVYAVAADEAEEVFRIPGRPHGAQDVFMASDGQTAAVRQWLPTGDGIHGTGPLQLMHKVDGLWRIGEEIPEVGDGFGVDVDFRGDALAVGSHDGVMLYQKSPSGYGQPRLRIEDPTPPQSADSRSIGSDVVLGGGSIFALDWQRQTPRLIGLVQVFDEETGALLQTLGSPWPDPEVGVFGTDLHYHEGRLAVVDTNGVTTWRHDGTSLVIEALVDRPNEVRSIDLRGDWLAVGETTEGRSADSRFYALYHWANGTWAQVLEGTLPFGYETKPHLGCGMLLLGPWGNHMAPIQVVHFEQEGCPAPPCQQSCSTPIRLPSQPTTPGFLPDPPTAAEPEVRTPSPPPPHLPGLLQAGEVLVLQPDLAVSLTYAGSDSVTLQVNASVAASPESLPVVVPELPGATLYVQADVKDETTVNEALVSVRIEIAFDVALDDAPVGTVIEAPLPSIHFWNGTRWLDLHELTEGSVVPAEASAGGDLVVYDKGHDTVSGTAWVVVSHSSTYALAVPSARPVATDPESGGLDLVTAIGGATLSGTLLAAIVILLLARVLKVG